MFKKLFVLILVPAYIQAVTFGVGEIERTVGIFNNQRRIIQLTDPRDVQKYEGRAFLDIYQESVLISAGSRRYFRMQPGSNFSLTVQSEGKRKVYRVVIQTFEVPRRGKVSIIVHPDGSDKLIEGINVQLIIGDPLLI